MANKPLAACSTSRLIMWWCMVSDDDVFSFFLSMCIYLFAAACLHVSLRLFPQRALYSLLLAASRAATLVIVVRTQLTDRSIANTFQTECQ